MNLDPAVNNRRTKAILTEQHTHKKGGMVAYAFFGCFCHHGFVYISPIFEFDMKSCVLFRWFKSHLDNSYNDIVMNYQNTNHK
uniref:Ovule protein n=1 Tax=Heterorhabditis bacteriophora TaxID=37862 RepID=A0A1I7XMR0_HETBA